MIHLNIKISGRVQGVFFRASAKREADKLNLTGLIRNEPDGSVYVEVEGSKPSIDKFVMWCKSGPQLAKVDSLETNKGQIKNYIEFSVW